MSYDIIYNAERRTVAKLCFNNIWVKFAQNPDWCTKEFVTKPRKFFELISDDTYNVSDVQIINDDCVYVIDKKSKEFQTPALNTNVIIASYVHYLRHHSRQTGVVQLLGAVGLLCIVKPTRSYTDTWRVCTTLLYASL